jgi:signal transduction histidine kinase
MTVLNVLPWIGRQTRATEEAENRARDARVRALFEDAPIETPTPVLAAIAPPPPVVVEATPNVAQEQVEERVVRDPRGKITALRGLPDRVAASTDERDRLKTELMGLASHQLRTPLTSIKGYAALLMDGEAGELSMDQREMVEVIRRNTDRLTALLEDVVNLARIPSAAA